MSTSLVASAQPAGQGGYRVPEGCPGWEWFQSELSYQGVPTPAERALELSVERRPVSGGSNSEPVEPGVEYDGSLRYGAGNDAWERRLTSGNCTDLLSALAVSLGLQLEAQTPREPDRPGGTAAVAEESPMGVEPLSTGGGDELPPDEPPADVGPDLSGAWMVGFGLGGTLRLGVDPEPSAGLSASVMLRSVRSGWGSGPVGVGFTLSPSSDREVRVDGQPTSWSYGWWATHLFVTPGTFLLPPSGRMGFVAAFHVGRYLPAGEGDGFAPQTLMFSELSLRGEHVIGAWLLDAQLGLQLPVEAVVVSSGGEVLHRQRAGLMVGLGATWLGAVL